MPCSGPQPGDPRRSFLWRNTDHARRDRCAGSRARLYRGPRAGCRRNLSEPAWQVSDVPRVRPPRCAGRAHLAQTKRRQTLRGRSARGGTKAGVCDAGGAGGRPLQPKVEGTAWNAKPSWYVLATQDQTVPPELQHFVSKRMKAATTEVTSSHVPMLSRPDVVLDVIRKAASAVSAS